MEVVLWGSVAALDRYCLHTHSAPGLLFSFPLHAPSTAVCDVIYHSTSMPSEPELMSLDVVSGNSPHIGLRSVYASQNTMQLGNN